MAVPENQITREVHRWLDSHTPISDAVALELFRQYRGSSDYPFAGVSAGGILEDAKGVLNDLAAVVDSLSLTGNIPRFEELAALTGWVHNWQDNHVDVDNEDDKISRVFGDGS